MGRQTVRALSRASFLRVITGVLAGGIFVADTLTNLEIAFPAFYTAVVLLSVSFCNKRGVVFVGAGCITLTLLSDLLTANVAPSETGVINTAISLVAITATTFLALKIESVKELAFEARTQLAHFVRVTTLGELAVSIAHEVNQPLAAAVTNGNACMRWLAAQPPNLDEARHAIARLVKDANRASDVITHVRALAKSSVPERERLNINEIILATVSLIDREIQSNQVSLHTKFSDDVLLVEGDRVQLQQVILNLVLNAIEAMNAVPAEMRKLVISSAKNDLKAVLISVQDSGSGFAADSVGRLFNAFYTTKHGGMGMGLAISRSIVETHGGQIWATPNSPCGAVVQFALPAGAELSL